MDNENKEIPATQVYVCPSQPNLKISVDVASERTVLQFKHGRLEVDGDEAEAFAAVLNNRRAKTLRGMVRLVDYDAAAALVAEHQAKRKAGAVKGPFDTRHRAKMLRQEIENRAGNLAHLTSEEQVRLHEKAVGDALTPLEAPPMAEKREATDVAAEAKAAITAATEAAEQAEQAAEVAIAAAAPVAPSTGPSLQDFLTNTPSE